MKNLSISFIAITAIFFIFMVITSGCGEPHIEPDEGALGIDPGLYWVTLERYEDGCDYLPAYDEESWHFIRCQDDTMSVTVRGFELISEDDSYFVFDKTIDVVQIFAALLLYRTDDGFEGEVELSVQEPFTGCRDYANLSAVKTKTRKAP